MQNNFVKIPIVLGVIPRPLHSTVSQSQSSARIPICAAEGNSAFNVALVHDYQNFWMPIAYHIHTWLE